MRKIIVYAFCIASALMFSGCAKHVASGVNDAEKRYFDAWMQVNHPDAQPSGLGVYIIDEEKGDGIEVQDGGFALVDYTITDLEGNISSYTEKITAKQLGEYDTTYFYGARFQSTGKGTLAMGVFEALAGMKAGGYRRVVVPSWLMSSSIYETEQEYLDNTTGGSSAIYDIHVRDFTKDMNGWQINRIGEYLADNQDIFTGMDAADSLASYEGFYYKCLTEPTDTSSFPSDTTIYINYTGKLLNGLVFDTTDEKTAKDNGLWSASKTYGPVKIKWGEEYYDITMGSSGSSTIEGFALTLWQMRAFEKGIGVFISDYGYGSSGSGKSIPGYVPLVFEIELVSEPE